VPDAVRIGLETGPLTTWLWQALTDAGLPMVCLDARQAKAALNMRINKTDDNDAEGLAHLVRSGWYREVRVKSREAMLVRSLLGARTQLLGMVTDLSNQIRGLMKTFGLVVPKGAGKIFEANVRRLLEGEALVAGVVLPLLESWRAVRARAADLDRQLLSVVRGSATCRRLMTIPGIGAVVAASFVAAVETPENFTTSRAVGAWIGLTPRRYQSGQVDDDGPISRRGDARLRALLYEAATAMLTRVQGESELRRWGLALKKRLGFKRAAVALARKMAVIMHAMWKNGADFDPKAASVAV
jgi:transposase